MNVINSQQLVCIIVRKTGTLSTRIVRTTSGRMCLRWTFSGWCDPVREERDCTCSLGAFFTTASSFSSSQLTIASFPGLGC